MNTSKSFKVTLVGCGQIAGGWESSAPSSTKHVLTHAKALKLHPAFEIAACFDADSAKAQAFAKTWAIPRVLKEESEVFSQGTSDVVVIASSTDSHFRLLQAALRSSCQAIVIEKPLVENVFEFKSVQAALVASDKKILCPLLRHFDPVHLNLAKRAQEEEWGEALNFSIHFSKGLLHNGAHALGLLSDFISPVVSMKPGPFFQREEDLYGHFQLSLKNGLSGSLFNAPNFDHGLFEAQFYFRGGSIHLAQGGRDIRIYQTAPSKNFPGFKESQLKEVLAPSLDFAFYDFYEKLATQGLKANSESRDFLRQAMSDLQVLLDVLSQAKAG